MGLTAAQRLLTVVAAFDHAHTTWTLTDLSEHLEMPLSTTHRLVGELLEWGALRRDEQGRLQVGARLWEIGSLYSGLDAVRDTAMPYLGDLLAATGHSVHLAALDGSDVVFLAHLTSGRTVPTLTRVGGRLPATITATGRVLLAYSPHEVVEEILAADAPPNSHATDLTTFRAMLLKTRRDGYTVATRQVTDAAVAAGAPIRDRWGTVCAAVALVADARVPGHTLVPLVVSNALAISRALGFRGATGQRPL